MTAPILEVSVPPVSPKAWEKNLFVSLSEGGDGCPDLSGGTAAFFNDTPLEMISAGHFDDADSFLVHTPARCYSTEFMARPDELPPGLREDVTRIRITQGDTAFSAEALDVCTPRGVTIISPADGVLRPGDEVELEWQHATDELHASQIMLRTPTALQELARSHDSTLRVEGNRLRFRMPQLQTVTQGTAGLEVVGDSRGLYRSVTRCEGFKECWFSCGSMTSRVSIPVTVQAR